jgi:hypothetical protein
MDKINAKNTLSFSDSESISGEDEAPPKKKVSIKKNQHP